MTHGSAGIAIPVAPAIALQLAAGRYPPNAMLGTAAGKFVNAGISMSFGRRGGAMPEPIGVPKPMYGMTRIAIRAKDATRVELGGDFNKWQLAPTTRAVGGVWYADLALPPGDYRYAFRIDGKEWRVPEGVAAADDEFGGKTAWLTVRKDARAASK
jgi:1,4-alpha-glucan branching enzyme